MRRLSLPVVAILAAAGGVLWWLDRSPPPSTSSTSTEIKEEPSNHFLFYSYLRPDRAGSELEDMLLADAYSFAHNLTYGGACGDNATQVAELQTLIHRLGWSSRLQLVCPMDKKSSPIVDRRFYSRQGARFWTSAWRTRFPPPAAVRPKTAAVHIRRGDVDPCRHPDRYLPNAYYQALIDRYVPADYQITLYSEADSFEPWNDWPEDYSLALDVDLVETWRAMQSAEIVILSKSSFSAVGAALRTSRTIYTDFWLQPSLSWTPVEPRFQRIVEQEWPRLQAQCQAVNGP